MEARSAPAYVVGVGASAGGLEALEQFFAEMPRETGLAFVVVQHLSPDFRSVMDELLARRTSIPVLLVEDGVRIEPDHIYLIPPKKEMIVSGGCLLLSDKGNKPELILPIDVFFRSLAEDLGPNAIAVVLSGGGSDGSRGIRNVHDAGGFVLCQDELSAAFDGMPRSARDTGVVDQVLSPIHMAKAIMAHVDRPHTPTDQVVPLRGVHAVYRLLHEAFGIDFSHYKPTTVLRRIDRRLHMGASTSLDAYVEQLAADPAELDALYRDLLIGVTRFFRDEEAFELLEREVIPELLERVKGDEIRVWSPGCATGEEAYSLAILLHEAMARRGDKRRLKVFATDVHPGSLETATRGLYDDESISRVSPARLARYFDRHGRSAQVSAELRQLIVFARHNVVRDAPFTRVDLLSCRNMLIYLQPLAQKKVLGLFHFALKNQGVLFLGPSETPGAFVDDFEPINAHWRLYKKQRDLHLAVDRGTQAPRAVEPRSRPTSLAPGHYNFSQTISIYDALLEEHMPASLLVNERRELVHAFAGAGRFVRVRDGRPSLDILDLVEPDLKMALAGALQRALKEKEAIVYQGIRLSLDGEQATYKLTVRPVHPKTPSLPHLLISIERANQATPPPQIEREIDAAQITRDQLDNLENELRYTKENLQATIEEVETSNEELQATNEELLASNEELQSTNEELQSVNEELFTVNAEYQKKIAQLTELTNDMDNLLLSTDVGTIFVDEQLKIRKFTPRIAETFDLVAHDVGRPLANFSHNLDHKDLIRDLGEVVKTGAMVEREARDAAGNWFFLRLLPYRVAGRLDGAVVTLVDMNGLKKAEDALFRERYLLESLMDGVPDLIYFKDARGRFVRINLAMTSRLGLEKPEMAAGCRAVDFVGADVADCIEKPDDAVLRGFGQPYRLERHAVPGGGAHWYMATRQPLRNREGAVVGLYAILRDVTEHKRAEEEIRNAVTRRDQFLAMLSHELRNPLGAVVNAARLMAEHCENGSVPRELEIIERQSQQMARLLDDLLESNRFAQSKITLQRGVVDLRLAIDDAASALAEAFSKGKLALHLDVDRSLLLINGDAARIQQVVVNLLGNACKYGRPGGNVWVTAKRERGQVILRVRDDGLGIDATMLSSIFELFVQIPSSIARTEGGIGVGLALVRTIVEMHGGTVAAASDGTGKGSTFSVALPALDDREQAEAVAHSRRPVSEREPSSALTIAIVDDNADSCEMLQELLMREGHEVHVAYDGAAGAALVERIRPDVAILDIGLPTMTGYEIAERLRGKRECDDTYLVALTGYGSAGDRAAAVAAGFDEHLVKPVDKRKLDTALRHAPATVRNVRT